MTAEAITVRAYVTEAIDIAEAGADRVLQFFIEPNTSETTVHLELVDAACALTRVAEMLKVVREQR